MAIDLETYKISFQGVMFIVDTPDITRHFETIDDLLGFIKNDLKSERTNDLIDFHQIGLFDK